MFAGRESDVHNDQLYRTVRHRDTTCDHLFTPGRGHATGNLRKNAGGARQRRRRRGAGAGGRGAASCLNKTTQREWDTTLGQDSFTPLRLQTTLAAPAGRSVLSWRRHLAGMAGATKSGTGTELGAKRLAEMKHAIGSIARAGQDPPLRSRSALRRGRAAEFAKGAIVCATQLLNQRCGGRRCGGRGSAGARKGETGANRGD